MNTAFTYSDGDHVTASGIKRHDYAYGHHIIGTTRHLRSSLRYGPYAWPGGHARAYMCSDGEMLCPACVRAEYRQISNSVRHSINDGWQVIACVAIDDTDTDECCAHCGVGLASL